MGNVALAGTVVAAAGATAWALIACCFGSSVVDADGREEKKSAMAEEIYLQKQRLEELLSRDVDCESRPEPRPYRLVEVGDHSIPRNPKPHPRRTQGTIKIMSYNIWCITHKIHERMKAIDQLIQQHSPDIILLQEVTPKIYKIFQNFNWWNLYKCSVPSEKATAKQYFCMLLSKLPVKKFSYKYFENTSKGLCIAKIKTGMDKKLVVATCHLKSPAFPEMNSTERVGQAKEAIKHFQNEENVVLGGDMNWDENSDGPFPLVGWWHDAWSSLKPDENGYTYDTESNGMLNHRRSLQRRLDRFVCKLKDFKMISIDMIGMEAIPGVSYKNKGQKLPVLPSDHYGLILTVCPK